MWPTFSTNNKNDLNIACGNGIPEVYIRFVQDMYQGATTCVKSKRGTREHFEVGIGLHQGSALSPFLFIMLVDTISQDVRN